MLPPCYVLAISSSCLFYLSCGDTLLPKVRLSPLSQESGRRERQWQQSRTHRAGLRVSSLAKILTENNIPCRREFNLTKRWKKLDFKQNAFIICHLPSVLKAVKISYISFWKTENKVIKAQWGLLEIDITKWYQNILFALAFWSEAMVRIKNDTSWHSTVLLFAFDFRVTKVFFPWSLRIARQEIRTSWAIRILGDHSISAPSRKAKTEGFIFKISLCGCFMAQKEVYTGVSGLWCFLCSYCFKGKV